MTTKELTKKTLSHGCPTCPTEVTENCDKSIGYINLTSLDQFWDSPRAWFGDAIGLSAGRSAGDNPSLAGGVYYRVTPELLGWMQAKLAGQVKDLKINLEKLSSSIGFFEAVRDRAAAEGIHPAQPTEVLAYRLPEVHPASARVGDLWT